MSDHRVASANGHDAGEPSHQVALARFVAAPPSVVFEAWTVADRIVRWLCPDPTARVSVENDLRLGGSWSVRMETSGGAFTAFGSYREIESPRRLVFTWDWKEPPQAMGVNTVAEVAFALASGGTDLRLVHCGFPSDAAAEGHKVGWELALERLEGLFSEPRVKGEPRVRASHE